MLKGIKKKGETHTEKEEISDGKTSKEKNLEGSKRRRAHERKKTKKMRVKVRIAAMMRFDSCNGIPSDGLIFSIDLNVFSMNETTTFALFIGFQI